MLGVEPGALRCLRCPHCCLLLLLFFPRVCRFKNFDWDALIQRKMKPPIVPKIKNQLDTSNFDDYPDEPAHIEDYQDDGSNWEAEF